MRISIIGTGNVGKALYKGLAKAGHEVRFGSRNPQNAAVPEGASVVSQKDCAVWGDVVFLAVPYLALGELVNELGADCFSGKVVVDVTNVLDSKWEWAVGYSTSGAEELAKKLEGAKVVKAFNTVFAEHMSTGEVAGEKATLFVAGDDDGAKRAVAQLGGEIGFDVIDAGGLKSARYLEPLGLLMIHLGYGLKMGSLIGLRLIKK